MDDFNDDFKWKPSHKALPIIARFDLDLCNCLLYLRLGGKLRVIYAMFWMMCVMCDIEVKCSHDDLSPSYEM